MTRFLRLNQIVNRKGKNGQMIPGMIPVSASTWWRGVQNGTFPKPIKITRGCTVWRESDIQRILADKMP